MGSSDSKASDIISKPTDGLNVKCISLDGNLVPASFEDSKLKDPGQAKQLFARYASETRFSLIEKMTMKANSAKAPSTRFSLIEIIRMKANSAKAARGQPADRQIVAAVGSKETIYSLGNCGLFAAVLTAYDNHWKLRTSPDDWWFCVIKRVACAIDKNAKKESVRKMFVDHEGKKSIEVDVPDNSISTVDYSWFFDQISHEVKKNVNVPEFVDVMTADFGSTTPVQRIASQITVMNSVKEYFRFRMKCGCGIPAVEMLGTEDDWSRLNSKVKILRSLLAPIENDLDLLPMWWDVVETVFSKLLTTYQGKPDTEWWSHMMSYVDRYASGMYYVPGEYRYRGWITEFLEGSKYAQDIDQMTSGLVSAPLTLKHPAGVVDTAAVVAGILGFTLHTDEAQQITVQPFQGWALLLAGDSPFHQYLKAA